jgi:hypothetical protein
MGQSFREANTRPASHEITRLLSYYKVKCKAVPVTGREGPYCETPRFPRIPHFLDNRLTDGGDVVSITRRPPFTPQEDSYHTRRPLPYSQEIPRNIS